MIWIFSNEKNVNQNVVGLYLVQCEKGNENIFYVLVNDFYPKREREKKKEKSRDIWLDLKITRQTLNIE